MDSEDRQSIPARPDLIQDEEEVARREAENALRQYDAVLDMIDSVARDNRPFRLRPSMISRLHEIALDGISNFAGRYRPGPVKIAKSKHIPPDAHRVQELVEELCDWVNEHWKDRPIFLSAYVMWRLNWIHPFEDGNGRTSRAVAYLVLCCRLGDRLPGRKTIPEQIAENKEPYYDALEEADSAYERGELDISKMEELLEGYLATQLKSVFENARAASDDDDDTRRFH